MSEKKADAAAPAKSGGKLKWIVIAVIVLAAGGGGAWMFLKPGTASGAASAKTAEAKEAPHAAALYYKFDPAFVVNFGGEGNSRFLQVTLEAMSRDPAVVEAVKANEPAIRNDLVLLFSAQQYDSLVSAEGKDKLRQETLEVLRKTVAAEGGKAAALENVYFTSFVIQ